MIVGFSRTRPEATSRTVCSRWASVLMSGKRNRRLRSRREVDVELHRGPEPGDADELAAGADRFDRLQQRPGAREALLRAPSRAFEDDVGSVAAGQLADRGDRVRGRGHSRRHPRPARRETRQASSRTSTVTISPAPLVRAIWRHSSPMLPCP